jgi:predicted RNA binding protein YcfA (HicA-like mRNA interferase family)
LPKLPVVSGRQVITVLVKLGFIEIRQKGSHVILKRQTDDGGVVGCVVPLHSTLAPGTLRGILRQAGVTIEEFIELL